MNQKESFKAEQAQKARKEIADYLAAGKDERARIRVEHIIREDYLVEAMEILELYCGLLLARFGLIQTTQELDSGLAESVSTLIWAAPRLQSEVPELKIVSNQLCAKYSQEYGRLCRTSEIGTVSPRVVPFPKTHIFRNQEDWEKLSKLKTYNSVQSERCVEVIFALELMCKLNVDTLPQVLVEQYLIEIAKNYNVPYKSQATIMAEAPADLVSVGFTDDVKKGAHDNGGGTVARPGDALEALPVSASGPLPVPSSVPGPSSLPYERQNDSYKNNLPPILVPGPRPNLETSPKPASRTKIGFDNFMPDLPDAKPQASLSIDPYDSEEVDFEDLDRRLEILKKAI
ncbi:IST1 homolog isoform X2 [Phyllostomus discolor]|uniref:IST1 homolog n=1 Tax=Phyllostomus discolor TaxID=89673 RepID=A0A7E6CM98_9CHIR|nr:IST1 homolog isoform X2 [Phyllostomus discolor]XP_035868043.1 IST1 homolog isoform X2 [Phyllostomus discolor]XP_035868044.1 IST1 homolog isoform X2 [Phyllostomus discolor]